MIPYLCVMMVLMFVCALGSLANRNAIYFIIHCALGTWSLYLLTHYA